jgi:hypothetical protein
MRPVRQAPGAILSSKPERYAWVWKLVHAHAALFTIYQRFGIDLCVRCGDLFVEHPQLVDRLESRSRCFMTVSSDGLRYH